MHHSDCIETEGQQMHHLFPNWHPCEQNKHFIQGLESGGAKVQWLACWTFNLKVGGSRPDLSHLIVSLDNKLDSTLSLSTQAPVVQKVDSTIHRINYYPVDKC